VKNAPAVTARRATNQIVLAAGHQALAVIAVVILPATAAEALVVIVVAEQVVRVEITHLIGLVVTGIGHTRRVPLVMVIVPIPPVRLGTGIPLPGRPVVTGRQLIGRVAMAQPARPGLLATVPIHLVLLAMVICGRHAQPEATVLVIRVATAIPRPGRHVPVETVPIRLAPLVMEILDRPAPAVETVLTLLVHPAMGIRGRPAQPEATDPTLLVLLAMVIHVHVAMARTAHVSPAVTVTRVRHVQLVEIAPIRRPPPATARARTDLEAIVRIVLARIVRMAISRVESGNPMGESAARSVRR